MENKSNQIYIEVYSILQLLGEEYINKLPKSLYSMIESNVIKNSPIKYNSLVEINENNVLKDSIDMIALFHLNYWCESQEEIKELNLLFKNNYIQNEAEKRERYNPNEIFKNKEIQTSIMVVTEKKWYEKIFELIKNIFKKK